MIPTWIQNDWKLQWHDGSDWFESNISCQKGQWQCETLPDAVITINVDETPNRTSSCTKQFQVQVQVHPGHNGTASGFNLVLPLSASLECTWKPHLAPRHEMTIGDKAFRSPAIVLEDDMSMCALIPDLEHLQRHREIPHIMDYVREDHTLRYGFSDYIETGHVYYQVRPRTIQVQETPLELKFFLVEWKKEPGTPKRDFRVVEQWLWENIGKNHLTVVDQPLEMIHQLEKFPLYTYEWAFDRWKSVCWQQFQLDGVDVGGVVFIVTAKQKPGMGSEEKWREPKSIWNQAWFCSLRSAYGYRLAGQRYDRKDWIANSDLSLEFALSAPQVNGLFPGYFQAGDDNRWESGRWYMSGPRRPEEHEDYVHLLDASWTCYWLLKWYRDITRDERILAYVRKYVETLVSLQQTDGSFPAWVKPETLERSPYLTESPETAIHVMLLCLLQEVDETSDHLGAALRAATFITDRIVSSGRWEDFETYWSCAKQWEGKRYGMKDPRSGLYHQCNFGMYWSTEAMKSLYKITGNPHWLNEGERILAELSLYQQIWQPHYFPVPTVGGFGVMNSDDEWNDARQSLFALTYYDYFELTSNEKYLARSLWAMKASFYMMYCPDNEEVKALYERVHTHFDSRDYGFHMENFNHHDGTAVNGLGEFTIFDWGCGAAAASLAELSLRIQRSAEVMNALPDF